MAIRPIAAALLLAILGAVTPASAQRQWIDSGPIPSRYEIAIVPDVEAGSFSGQETIIVQAAEAAPAIVLNALDISIDSARIDGASAAVTSNEASQTVTLTPRRPLRPGRHTIRIAYRGKIYDEAYGLFRVSYREADGTTKRALATQFEPGDARRLAPMWDQPNRRAVFSMTVTAPADQMAISNMPIAQTQLLRGGLARTRFEDSPAMSSYLLFLGVGDFERVTQEVDGVQVGVVVRRGATARAREALQAGVASLHYYNQYFGVPYPLPKLDMIAVPGAGGFGAMENWGAILYFDQYLLLDEDRSSEADRQGVFGIVAHEIAHQWFGNFVTMEWWDNLWLNEGFASWMAAKATEALHPDWKPWLAELSEGTSGAMTLDSRAGTHPIVQEVNTIDEANQAFDTITYQKGLAVLRMLEAYVGAEDFRAGVHNYLEAHRYGNARTEEFWSAIQDASDAPVIEIARSFTTQPGYPLLSVHGADCAAHPSNGMISTTQRRFAMDDSARTDALWTIPVVAQALGGQPVRTVLPARANGVIAMGACEPTIVNAGHTAFFRTLYDDAALAQLASAFPQLSGEDQLGLLLDYWAFGRSGDAPFTAYLELAKAVPANADPVILQDTVGSMLALDAYAQGRPAAASVRAYVRRTVRAYFDRVGWDARGSEGSNDALLRATLIGALGTLDDADIVAEARRRVSAARADSSALPAAIRDATLAVYALNATPDEYEELLSQARAATDFVEQRRLWRQLAGVHDEALARRTLDLTLGEEIPRLLRPQVLGGVSNGHPRLAWDFLRAHRDAFESYLDPLQRFEFATGIASGNSDPAVAAELETYASNYPPGLRSTVDAAKSTILIRAETIATRMPAVEEWIARQSTPAPTPTRARRASR